MLLLDLSYTKETRLPFSACAEDEPCENYQKTNSEDIFHEYFVDFYFIVNIVSSSLYR